MIRIVARAEPAADPTESGFSTFAEFEFGKEVLGLHPERVGRQISSAITPPQHVGSLSRTHTPRCRLTQTVLVGPDSFQNYYDFANDQPECVINEANTFKRIKYIVV
jgi:hypothetical protein